MTAATLFPDLEADAAPVLEPATDPAKLFDPKHWFYDPVSRRGLPYDGMRPCSCGSLIYLFITRGIGDRDHHVFCETCYADPRYRLSRPQDLIYAKLDKRTKTVTYTRSIEQILEMRKRIKAK
jgi:hypothetical protein